MGSLAELDAAGNLISQLPITIGDLRSLRALNLRANQLGLLPLRELKPVFSLCFTGIPTECAQLGLVPL